MEQKIFKQGALILRQGEAGDFVCHIQSGMVEIFMEMSGQELILGLVKPGEFLGEMSVIGGYAYRSASARAQSEVTVHILDREEFLFMVSKDVDLAYRVIERLSERLRSSNQRLAQSVTPVVTEDIQKPGLAVKLFAGGPELEPFVPTEGITVDNSPFSVGRRSESAGRRHVTADLAIPDSKPYRLSRRHFAVSWSGNEGCVIDLASTLGTEVNGRPIGEHFGTDRAALELGVNSIAVGGQRSPFVFEIRVEATND